MQNTSLSFLQILSIAALVAANACSGELRRPESAVTEAVPGGFVVPDGWSFPPGQVVPTYGAEGMVSTTDRVASEMGVEVLRRGGNAVDAAVAIHFALAVVNPEAGNIGGGGFMVVRMADRRTAALDFREKAPRAAARDMYLDPQGAVTDRAVVGHLAAGVPGSVAGMWEAHQRFGSRPWAELVQPAVNLAGGIVVHERLAQSLQTFERQLQRYPTTAAAFLLNGRAPLVGDRLAQRDLAETLRRIARDGKEGFYRGRTAALVVAEMHRGGGIISHEDLGSYEAVWRDPIVFQYRQHTLVSMPPPSSGGATLAEILNILEGYDLRALGYHSRDHVHLWTEAVKRAFADRNEYLADPDFVPQPTERMTSDAYAAERRAAIQADRATPSDQVRPGMGPAPARPRAAAHREGEATTHYSVLDREGNAVAVTTSINSLYGNLVTVAGAGFLLNNEMDDFAARPGMPNQSGLVQGEANGIEPQKRMVSSMTPTIVLDPRERVKLITGSAGGPTVITQIAQIISNIVDFNMDIGSATVAPRLHHQHLPDVLHYERAGLRPDVESALRALGHAVEARPGYWGVTQSILVLPDGTVTGVADPRVGGAALSVRDNPYGRASFPRPTPK
jgi:gamma-glutamyltranspeptidase / glutathione hydrolase